MSQAAPDLSARSRAVGIVATGTILAILYFARDVLVPITLAVILSLLISPLVRGLRRAGLGQTSSVLVAVLALSVSFASVAFMAGVQLARMAASLPQYEHTIRHKLATLNALTVGRLHALSDETRRLVGEHIEQDLAAPEPVVPLPVVPLPVVPTPIVPTPIVPTPIAPTPISPTPAAAAPAATVSLQAPGYPDNPLQVIEKVLASVWVPLETTGIMLVVLVFVLLEHEAMRDRFIRIAGGTDVRATTLALNDASERLSRFFVSQFTVNFGVGIALWVGLAIIGLPHAVLWASLAAALRFVPYVGVWIAAFFSVLLGAAVDPGWTLAIATLTLFIIVELIASQLVEPELYGHTTGMSPLSVVVAAIFWSWLWGPVGLIVSTPLTLCLVVAGRHIKALSLLDILLGDTRALSMSQRFYQRALSADSEEIIASARAFLKGNSFAAYCDLVLMPALHLAFLDVSSGAISREQQLKVRNTIVAVIAALGGETRNLPRRRSRVSVLDDLSAGRQLRQQREQLTGRWQGPLAVPPGSVMLCVGLGSIPDDLATELLVRILRDQKLDARHLSVDDLQQVPPPEAAPGSVSMVYLVSAFPSSERLRAESTAAEIRRRFPGAFLVTVLLPGLLLQAGPAADTIRGADKAAGSFSEALQICLDWLREQQKPDA
ncbi:MAG: AI-2E family transporter [Steroidobacteraceae bacterium]